MRRKKQSKRDFSRRDFLKGAAAGGVALGAPVFVPSTVLGRDGGVAPSNRIVMGAIGYGNQGRGNTGNYLNDRLVQMVAVCDVDRERLVAGKEKVDGKYGNKDCAAAVDYRELTRRDDIDALVVTTPDHWHVPIGIDAARHGKDAYIEKPLTLAIGEGRRLVEEARRHNRVVQAGSQQRSGWEFHRACELVRNGRIGKIKRVEVGLSRNNRRCEPTWTPQPVPPGFDYDRWLGPAPEAPYHEQRCHYQFRFILDYSGGQVTNWGAHHLDIAQWGLGMDESGPVELVGRGKFPETGLFTTALEIDFDCYYAGGVLLHCSNKGDVTSGTRFIGEEGEVHVNRGKLSANPESILKEFIGPDETRLYKSKNHHDNFLECVLDRTRPAADVEIGHRSSTVCHLGNIAMLLKRKLQWDPKKERFVNDAEANRMLNRPARTPYIV